MVSISIIPPTDQTKLTTKSASETPAEKEKVMEQENESSSADPTIGEYNGLLLAGSSSPLISFNVADYKLAIQSNKLIVLYFYANWCPLCKAEFPKMQQAFNTLTTDQVIGFRVNFKDNETDQDEVALAREFGVAYQHTKIFIKNGQRILKAPDSWDSARYTQEISKAL